MPRGRPSLAARTAFGQRLRAAREAAGLSQAEVAARLGLKQAAYASWERYPTAIRPEQIEKVAAILKTPVKDLFEKTSRAFRRNGPTGRARRAFEAVSELPRYQQANVLDFVEVFLVSHTRRRKDPFAASERNVFLRDGEPAHTSKQPKAT
jgi:transcriptional regulator with XRE-family HTH domain